MLGIRRYASNDLKRYLRGEVSWHATGTRVLQARWAIFGGDPLGCVVDYPETGRARFKMGTTFPTTCYLTEQFSAGALPIGSSRYTSKRIEWTSRIGKYFATYEE